MIIYNIASLSFRSKYYVPWMISQLGLDFSGLSYNNVTGSYDLYQNARVFDIEWTYWDAKSRVKLWNMGTQKWLNEAFYKRWEGKLGKSTASLSSLCLNSDLYVLCFLAWFLLELLYFFPLLLCSN